MFDLQIPHQRGGQQVACHWFASLFEPFQAGRTGIMQQTVQAARSP